MEFCDDDDGNLNLTGFNIQFGRSDARFRHLLFVLLIHWLIEHMTAMSSKEVGLLMIRV